MKSNTQANSQAASALYRSALAAHRAGRLTEAEEGYRQVLLHDKRHADGFHMLGIVRSQQGHPADAEILIRRALAIREEALFLGNLGKVLEELGRLPEAEAAYRRAIAIRPDSARAHVDLGRLLLDAGRLAETETAYRRALELRPDDPDTLYNLGLLLQETNRPAEAGEAYRQALELRPDHADAHNNLGNVLVKAKRLADAEASYRRALGLEPDSADTHNNLGNLLKETDRRPEAEAAYRRALELRPDYAAANYNLGFLLLAMGQYAEGWRRCESRYDVSVGESNVAIPDLPYPQWRGESLAGKSLLIWPEQGFGDYIQFVRYATLLKARGTSRLTLFCAPPLKELLKTVAGVDAVITDLAALPRHDYWSFPLSLPLHFLTTVDTIPHTLPYLHGLPARLQRWRDRLPTEGLKVGLVWKGSPAQKNDANRSLPNLATLAPLWSVPGVAFVSLQKGQGEEEARQSPATHPIVPLGSDIMDFADTAAIVTELDLVIGVCTAATHLTGALGKPCWVLLPAFGADWRWLLDRSDSPWYPGAMRIFRQSALDSWSDTVADVATALKNWACASSSGRPANVNHPENGSLLKRRR